MCNDNSEKSIIALDMDQKKSALMVSLDTRKFEIDLYWKRAAYFWAFIAATFAGYFLVLAKADNGDIKTIILYVLNCLGIFTSWIWYLELKGSKYWQENWEKHVSDKETNVHGEVFNKIITLNNHCIFGLKSYPFSVSKLNLILSIYIIFVWIILFVYPSNLALLKYLANHCSYVPLVDFVVFAKAYKIGIFKFIIFLLLVTFVVYTLLNGKSSFHKKVILKKNIKQPYYNFKNNEYWVENGGEQNVKK